MALEQIFKCPRTLRSLRVGAPSAAWCFFWGVSPHWVKLNQQPISSVAPVAESWMVRGEQYR